MTSCLALCFFDVYVGSIKNTLMVTDPHHINVLSHLSSLHLFDFSFCQTHVTTPLFVRNLCIPIAKRAQFSFLCLNKFNLQKTQKRDYDHMFRLSNWKWSGSGFDQWHRSCSAERNVRMREGGRSFSTREKRTKLKQNEILLRLLTGGCNVLSSAVRYSQLPSIPTSVASHLTAFDTH